MRRLLILLLCSTAWATTTVTGNMNNLGSVGVTGGFMRFWLRGCAGNQPRVTGQGIIAPSLGGVYYFDLVASASGVISGTLYSNRDSTGLLGGEIECGGSTTATWYGMQAFFGGKGGPETAIYAKNGATFDISNVTPITVNPVITAPTGDSTYFRVDAGNSPVTGPATFNSTLNAQRTNGTLNATFYPGADIGAQINAAITSAPCIAPTGCRIHIPAGTYSYTTPIVLSGGSLGPTTIECDPGGSTGGSTYGTLLNYTPSSGIAFTWGAGVNGGGMSGCQIKGSGAGNSTTGLYISTIQGGIFSNVEIQGFGTGLQLNTAANHAYIDTFNYLDLHGNTTNLLANSNAGVTNENVTFLGGNISQNGGAYSGTCVNISNFEMMFVSVSFDGCPITIVGGANSHFTFVRPHFEYVLGSSVLDVLSVSSACAACGVTLIDPNIVENAASARTEFFTAGGTGTFNVITPQIFAKETLRGLVTKTNAGVAVQVQNMLVTSGTITQPVYNTITSNSDFGIVGVSGNLVTAYYQSVRDTGGCTTPATAGASCVSAVTIVWPAPFADANYSATCTGRGITNQPGPVYVVSKGTNQLVFNYQAQTNAAAAWTDVDCIAIHD